MKTKEPFFIISMKIFSILTAGAFSILTAGALVLIKKVLIKIISILFHGYILNRS
jgi:hypothetical protein